MYGTTFTIFFTFLHLHVIPVFTEYVFYCHQVYKVALGHWQHEKRCFVLHPQYFDTPRHFHPLLHLQVIPCCLSITDSRAIEDFNESFVAAWKATHNYKQLQCETNEALNSIPVGSVCFCTMYISVYFDKITAFNANYSFRNFRVSVIFYCP